MTDAQIEEQFRHHPPTPEKAEAHAAVTTTLTQAAREINALVPDCRGKSLAITKLEEAKMWANQALATFTGP